MVRTVSVFAMFLAMLVAVNTASAADKPHKTSAERFDAMEQSAKHDPLTGVLTKDEFVAAVKELQPKMADKAEGLFDKITKADAAKVTKDEYVTYMKTAHKSKKAPANS